MPFFRTVRVPDRKGGILSYVRLVDRWREAGRLRERTVCTLGRLQDLPAFIRKLAAYVGPTNFIAAGLDNDELRDAVLLLISADDATRAAVLATLRQPTNDDNEPHAADTMHALTTT